MDTNAKVVCPWLHKKPRREFIQARLQDHAADEVHTLDAGCEKFADWRWTALSKFISDIARMETTIRDATAGKRAADLAMRDSFQAQKFLTVVRSQVFWQRHSALECLAKPVAQLSS